MALFRNTDGALFAGLGDELGRKAEVLAHAVGEGVVAAGTREVFAVATDGQWRVWPWEQISGGSWKADTSRFVWKTMEGEKLEVTLEQANRLPQLFRERVEASTVVQALIDAPGRGEVQLIARRSLGAEPSVHWYAVASGGADLGDPATREVVVAETDRLSAEYFPG